MGPGKGLGNLLDLAAAFGRAEIDGGPDGGRAHIVGLFHRGEKGLVVDGRQGEQFVVVDFKDKRDFVGVFAGHAAKGPKGRGHGVAAGVQGQFDDVFRIEIDRIGGK